jgi:hypothetical protein
LLLSVSLSFCLSFSLGRAKEKKKLNEGNRQQTVLHTIIIKIIIREKKEKISQNREEYTARARSDCMHTTHIFVHFILKHKTISNCRQAGRGTEAHGAEEK